MALTMLGRRVSMLPQRLKAREREPSRPWQKSALTPKRITGRALQARNERIKERDGWTCQACGRISDNLEVDHITPVSRGGTDDDSNLQSLCAGKGLCHEQKTLRERLA